MDWVQFKDYLSQATSLHQDALHIYAAVLVQLAAAALVRRPIAHPLPWLILLAVLSANEAMDLRETEKAIEQWQIAGGLRDLFNTMAVPTLLLLAARYAPSLVTAPGKPAAAAPRMSEDPESR
jgi:hypothetical protein